MYFQWHCVFNSYLRYITFRDKSTGYFVKYFFLCPLFSMWITYAKSTLTHNCIVCQILGPISHCRGSHCLWRTITDAAVDMEHRTRHVPTCAPRAPGDFQAASSSEHPTICVPPSGASPSVPPSSSTGTGHIVPSALLCPILRSVYRRFCFSFFFLVLVLCWLCFARAFLVTPGGTPSARQAPGDRPRARAAPGLCACVRACARARVRVRVRAPLSEHDLGITLGPSVAPVTLYVAACSSTRRDLLPEGPVLPRAMSWSRPSSAHKAWWAHSSVWVAPDWGVLRAAAVPKLGSVTAKTQLVFDIRCSKNLFVWFSCSRSIRLSRAFDCEWPVHITAEPALTPVICEHDLHISSVVAWYMHGPSVFYFHTG